MITATATSDPVLIYRKRDDTSLESGSARIASLAYRQKGMGGGSPSNRQRRPARLGFGVEADRVEAFALEVVK